MCDHVSTMWHFYGDIDEYPDCNMRAHEILGIVVLQRPTHDHSLQTIAYIRPFFRVNCVFVSINTPTINVADSISDMVNPRVPSM